jgi:acyl-CoA synthetase (AMP-forming)/AMP-acid ligase II
LSIGLLLEMAAAGYSERIALGPRAGGITYERLAVIASGGATVIRDRAPKHVVFIGRNGPAFPQLLFASAMAGVPFTPLNYRLARTTLEGLVRTVSKPLIVVDAEYATSVASGYDTLTTDEFVILAAASTAGSDETDSVDDRSPAVVLFTSGTTSAPKAVVLRHENLVSYILSTVEFGTADPDDAALVSVPPYHVAAVGAALSNLYAGRRMVYLPDFDPAEWLNLVRAESITSAMLVPTMLARIVDQLGDQQATAPALQLITYGGARMPRPVLERALRAFPDAGFCNAYGLTETSSTLALLGPEEHREALTSSDPDIRGRLGSVGRPVPGIDIRITDGHGGPVRAGEVGRLWVRGAQVSGEYAGQASVLDSDGWFDTRDDATIDADGFLYVRGRADDTIIRGGENIAPAEIEDVLHAHPGVKDVAVVGQPDEEWGERIVAVVVPHPGVDVNETELRSHVRRHLRGSRTPDAIVWRTGELPHTPTGKLLRRELASELTTTREVPVIEGKGTADGAQTRHATA